MQDRSSTLCTVRPLQRRGAESVGHQRLLLPCRAFVNDLAHRSHGSAGAADTGDAAPCWLSTERREYLSVMSEAGRVIQLHTEQLQRFREMQSDAAQYLTGMLEGLQQLRQQTQ